MRSLTLQAPRTRTCTGARGQIEVVHRRQLAQDEEDKELDYLVTRLHNTCVTSTPMPPYMHNAFAASPTFARRIHRPESGRAPNLVPQLSPPPPPLSPSSLRPNAPPSPSSVLIAMLLPPPIATPLPTSLCRSLSSLPSLLYNLLPSSWPSPHYHFRFPVHRHRCLRLLARRHYLSASQFAAIFSVTSVSCHPIASSVSQLAPVISVAHSHCHVITSAPRCFVALPAARKPVALYACRCRIYVLSSFTFTTPTPSALRPPASDTIPPFPNSRQHVKTNLSASVPPSLSPPSLLQGMSDPSNEHSGATFGAQQRHPTLCHFIFRLVPYHARSHSSIAVTDVIKRKGFACILCIHRNEDDDDDAADDPSSAKRRVGCACWQ